MRRLALVLLLLLPMFAVSQTKLIAFKSHSGNTKNFRAALSQNLFDLDNSNLGLDESQTLVFEERLDSVVYLDANSVILKSTIVKKQRFTRQSDKAKKVSDTLRFAKAGQPIDTLKKIIDYKYYFKNSTDSVKFIGFDKKSKKKKQQFVPFLIDDHFPSKMMMILMLLGLSVLVAFFSWKINKNQWSAS